jgi:terminal uridylyltransferase
MVSLTLLTNRLIDFFRYYSRDFSYNTGVASIRAGLLKKDSKGWQNDVGFRYKTRAG